MDTIRKCQDISGNICASARRKRAVLGIASLTAGIGLGALLLVFDAGRWWRLLVFFPLQFGILGILQAIHGICAAYAAMGLWQIGSRSPQKVPDPRLENQFKDLAKRILLLSGALSGIATAAFACI